MTYKLNPELRLITSPVVLIFPGGARHSYISGAAVAEQVFNEKYRVVEIKAAGDVIEIQMEPMTTPVINAIGEETFFGRDRLRSLNDNRSTSYSNYREEHRKL